MFTGIITETGTIANVSRSKIAIRASRAVLRTLDHGTSIAVDGACLTVIAKNKSSFAADIMPETMRRTTLGRLRRGDTVNLELPATPSSLLSGHIVQGHIDGIGTLKQIKIESDSHIFSISVPRTLARYIVEKGSVTVNGVALTVIDVRASEFTVSIIPHTWKMTMIHTLKPNDHINIEVDVLGKYIEKLIRKH